MRAHGARDAKPSSSTPLRTAIGKRKGALAGWHPTDLLGLRAARARRAQRRRPGRHRRRRRRLRDAGGRAGLQRHPQRVGRGRAAVARAGDERRPAVRLVAAGRALRRAGRDRRRVRHRDRVRRRVDDAGADVVERARRHRPVQPATSSRHTNNTLGIQFWVAQVLADKCGVTREEMDAFALRAHQRAAANTDNGFFAERDRPGADQGRGRASSTGEVLDSRRGDPARDDARDARRRCRRRGSPTSSPRPTSPPATRRR